LDRRARTADRRTDDPARAIELAQGAVEQLHRWSGPSIDALTTITSAFSTTLWRNLEGRQPSQRRITLRS
jgi:hypothetical protein